MNSRKRANKINIDWEYILRKTAQILLIIPFLFIIWVVIMLIIQKADSTLLWFLAFGIMFLAGITWIVRE
jgi:hypothetical protein